MRDLQRERERLGLSREEVAAQTRIPLKYVIALEDAEDTGKNPPPFLFGYRRQYEGFLDTLGDGEVPAAAAGPAPYVRAEPAEEVEPEEAPRPFPVARLVLGGFLVTLALVLAVKIGSTLLERGPAGPAEPEFPIQKVDLRAIEPTRVTVIADGVTLFSGTLEPGATRTFEGRERLSVDTSDLTRLTVRHDGARIEPLGNLTYGRRLVFIQEKP